MPDDEAIFIALNVVSVLARIIAVVLRKQSVPEDEIGRMVDQIKLICKKISKGKI